MPSSSSPIELATLQPGYRIAQPPHGYVRYIDHLGSDQRIVEAARVSYGSPSKGPDADSKLLEYLYRNRHTSPFEQCSITFNIKFPIFLMRQFVRHRTARLNEVSARYTKLPDEFFLPASWRVQNISGNKQGSTELVTTAEFARQWQSRQSERALAVYEFAYQNYLAMLQDGVAQELARIILPVGIYTEIYVNIDLHNLMHFLRLRMDSHAQAEMREVAHAMCHILGHLYPWTAAVHRKYKMQMVESYY